MSYRFSEAQFRRYEPLIADIVNNWPVQTTIDPSPYSQETISCRLRDAIKSHVTNGWTSNLIKFDKFLSICDEITVSTATPGKVVVGPEESFHRPLSLVSSDEVTTQLIPKLDLLNPTLELFVAVCVLHSHRILSEPTVIRFNPYEENEYQAFADRVKCLDIAINDTSTLLEPGRTFTII